MFFQGKYLQKLLTPLFAISVKVPDIDNNFETERRKGPRRLWPGGHHERSARLR